MEFDDYLLDYSRWKYGPQPKEGRSSPFLVTSAGAERAGPVASSR